MRVGLLGCGTIGSFVLEAAARGQTGDARVVAVAGRPSSAGRATAERHGLPYVDPGSLPGHDVAVIVEAASHDAVRAYVPGYLQQGIDVITISGGVLADDTLAAALMTAAKAGGARLYVPSGAIAGLDGIKALSLGSAEVTITSSKPPAAWKGIPYVEQLGIDLEHLKEPVVLYEGEARRAVALFPQNVNVAAALSLAGVGFDRTKSRVIADPRVRMNIHEITATGPQGTILVRVENVPTPTNPRTGYLACLSVVAMLRQLASPLWVGG